MKQLFDDKYAPITSAIGFLRASFTDVTEALTTWRRAIHERADLVPLAGGLEENIHRLEPLTGGIKPRELVVATRGGEWVAVLDCGLVGGDPVTTIGYLAQTMLVQGLAFVSIPASPAASGRPQRYGARQFEMFGPLQTQFLNHVRAVSLVEDGARWRLDLTGTPQDFEDIAAYSRRRIQQRFTDEMLRDYSAALGIRPSDDDFYVGPSALVTNSAPPAPGGLVLSLAEARVFIGAESRSDGDQ